MLKLQRRILYRFDDEFLQRIDFDLIVAVLIALIAACVFQSTSQSLDCLLHFVLLTTPLGLQIVDLLFVALDGGLIVILVSLQFIVNLVVLQLQILQF
jgi:uncharacterized membrane-anchored protein